eukprot:scaffold10284_cov118-Isochrysis_galbana.AAC.2
MSVHLLGMSISRLMHCAEAVLMTYDAYYLRSAEPMNLLPTEHPGWPWAICGMEAAALEPQSDRRA